MRLLLVDDEPVILEVLEDMFQGYFANLSIDKASDGALALHLAVRHDYDLVITDYRMPALDGLEFTQLLRAKTGPNQKVPIIFLSGFIPDFKYQAEVYQNVYFLEKPVSAERLIRLASIATNQKLLMPVAS